MSTAENHAGTSSGPLARLSWMLFLPPLVLLGAVAAVRCVFLRSRHLHFRFVFYRHIGWEKMT